MGIKCDECREFSDEVTEFLDGKSICIRCEAKRYGEMVEAIERGDVH